MTTRTTKSHTTSLKLRTAGILRNLIAICFLVSVALGGTCSCGAYGCEARSFTLTAQKARYNKARDTSTIKVIYHPNRVESGDNHKFEKVRSGWNEWFSITKMLDHDKENNRILVQLEDSGMANRWIYYLEHDGLDFIELLKEEDEEKAVKVTLRCIDAPVWQGRVEGLPCKCSIGDDYRGEKNWDTPSRRTDFGNIIGIYKLHTCELGRCGGSGRVFPTQEELKRGDAANGVYAFRVKFQKDSSHSSMDDVSICVYLKQCSKCHGTGYYDNGEYIKSGDKETSEHVRRTWRTLGSCNDEDKKCKSCDGKGFNNKVDYITVPQGGWSNDLQAHIMEINCFRESKSSRYKKDKEGTVVLRLTRVLGSNWCNVGGDAADRKLFLGGKDATGIEGKKLLKFLIDYAGTDAEGRSTYIEDGNNFKKFQDTITADWDLNKLPHPDQVSAPAALEILPTGADQPDASEAAGPPNGRRLADRLAWN